MQAFGFCQKPANSWEAFSANYNLNTLLAKTMQKSTLKKRKLVLPKTFGFPQPLGIEEFETRVASSKSSSSFRRSPTVERE